MSPHLSAKLLKPTSPLPESSDDEEMVYSPYYRTPVHAHSCRKPRRRSHQLSPEVRAEIVARVLDPAYSGRRDTSSRVFVDTNGDAHDPDYQIFPIYHTRRASQTTSPSGGFFRRMPSDDDLSHEDDGAESEAEWARVRTASPYTSGASTSSTSPPPHEPISLFDDEWDEKEWTREVVIPVVQPKRRKYSKASSVTEVPRTVFVPVTTTIIEPVAAMEEVEHDSPAVAYSRHSAVELVREDTMDTTDTTPSCGYVLRRQWATFALHTRLSAHRIARRARRAVSVGT